MTGHRPAFTLVELLIVVVIIGILAAIAIPKFANTKEKAYFATMKADLRNVASAQEGYAADNGGSYATGPATGPAAIPGLGFAPSTGVTMEVTATATGWSAVATMAQTPRKCGMFLSKSEPPSAPGGTNPAIRSGEPQCN